LLSLVAGPLMVYELAGHMCGGMNPSTARGSAWEDLVDRGEGHITVMIPYHLYRKLWWYLRAGACEIMPH